MSESTKTTPPINALDALVALTRAVRPAWDVPGVRSAIRQALAREQQPTLAELAYALIRCAENPGINAPVVVALDGAHWGKAISETAMPEPARLCHQCADFHPPNRKCNPDAWMHRTPEREARVAYVQSLRDQVKPCTVPDFVAQQARKAATDQPEETA